MNCVCIWIEAMVLSMDREAKGQVRYRWIDRQVSSNQLIRERDIHTDIRPWIDYSILPFSTGKDGVTYRERVEGTILFVSGLFDLFTDR